ncbi:DUF7144 family membrane protein [Nocardioides sp.]|uniref:DUF7144 family membrane protein n=1 Tax=Nocardioides sp. TaxID=35761 RepID=UPI002ED41383
MVEQRTTESRASRLATGFITFAGVMMIMTGAFQALVGLVAIAQDDFYVTTPNYIFEFDPTTWGWIHVILGIVVVAGGFGVLAGQTWGRVVGIVLALGSALTNFAFIPYYPFWSMLIIALDVFVIWALAAHGRDFEMRATY